MRFSALLFFVFVVSFATAQLAYAVSGIAVVKINPISPCVTPSRQSGVAPLGVNFDTTCTLGANSFFDLQVTWDYGDPNSTPAGTCGQSVVVGEGFWRCGAGYGANSKNTDIGPIGGHLYETPGQYHPCATFYNGTDTATFCLTITVDDPNIVFALTTCCAIPSGSDFSQCFTANPAQHFVNADCGQALNDMQAAGCRRIVFRRGSTFANCTGYPIREDGPGILGAFGTGAKPIFKENDDYMLGVGVSNRPTTVNDWRLMDLMLDGNGINGNAIRALGTVKKFSFVRIDTIDINNVSIVLDAAVLDNQNLDPSPTVNGQTMFDSIYIQDSVIKSPGVGSLAYGGFIYADKFNWLGNYVDWTAGLNGGSHNLRIPYCARCAIKNNNFIDPGSLGSPGAHTLKLHSSNPTAPIWGDFSAGSAVIRNVTDFTNLKISMGLQQFVAGVDTRIASFDPIARTITMDDPAVNNSVGNYITIARFADSGVPWSGVVGWAMGNGKTSYVNVSDNIHTDTGTAYIVDIGTQNDRADERPEYVLFERNQLNGGDGGAVGLVITSSKITARDNIFNLVNANRSELYGVYVFTNGVSPQPNAVTLFNNSLFTNISLPTSAARLCVTSLNNCPVNVTIKNLLAYSPSVTSPLVVEDLGAVGTTLGGNSSNAQMKSTKPWAATTPALPIDYKPNGGSYAIGGGVTVPVYSDFFGLVAPTPRNIGAVNP